MHLSICVGCVNMYFEIKYTLSDGGKKLRVVFLKHRRFQMKEKLLITPNISTVQKIKKIQLMRIQFRQKTLPDRGSITVENYTYWNFYH